MFIVLSQEPDQAVIDYTLVLLSSAGFHPIPDQPKQLKFQSSFQLQNQATALTVQQHLTIGVISLFLLEHGVKVALHGDPSEKFAVISALGTHKLRFALFGDNVAVPALQLLA
jgi:hypothetical protein